MIKLSHLKKRFQAETVFEDFNLVLPDSGLFLLQGPNGSGKSTLLFILGLWDFSYQGSYIFQGQEMSSLSRSKIRTLRQRDFSFVTAQGDVIPEWTVRQNLNFELGVKQDFPAFLPSLEMEQKGDSLSGGETILLTLSHEILLTKKVYLLDEVTDSLDDDHTQLVLNALKKMATTSLVILATHDNRVASAGVSVSVKKTN
jgi:putative ABC transport system ATP-binding protein